MKILFASAEVAPFAKVGGLADVAGSLPAALSARGHKTVVVMPAYGMVVRDPRWGAVKAASFPVRVRPGLVVDADLYHLEHDGVTHWLLDGDKRFALASKSEEVYTFDPDDYLFFAQAALDACEQAGFAPDIVHAHDWQMGFLPVYLREAREGAWDRVASCFTVHNLAYQGEFAADTVERAGLPWSLFDMHRLETYGGVNFLKSGCVYADQVNTVSPTYAQEITTPEFGCRLEGLMAHLAAHQRLRGILNGIDTVGHDPATDPLLPAHFSAADPTGKSACRAALLAESGLKLAESSPLLGVVSRLSGQKGFDLILGGAERLLGMGTGLIVLGTGDPVTAKRLRALQAAQPGRVCFVEAYDAPLAQRIYGGADIFLMPSVYEPCGLGQMFAMRYGTVPVVRHTGGLADTVFEGENGFVFDGLNVQEFAEAVSRAVAAFRDRKRWAALVQRAMTGDFTWNRSALAYAEMYEAARASRASLAVR